MRTPKCFIPGTLYEITSTMQEGLPLVPSAPMNEMLEGPLAAAQTLYPVKITDMVFMANHLHIMLIPIDPEDVPRFMRYLKCETAHIVNNLLGRRERSVWNAGYKAVPIFTPEMAWARMLYILLNPVRANLVSSAAEYPGISSYRALLQGGITRTCKKLARYAVPRLPDRPVTSPTATPVIATPLAINVQQELAHKVRDASGTYHKLTITPFGWLDCFPEWKDKDVKALTKAFLEDLRAEEKKLARDRACPPLGAKALQAQDPRKPYQPERSGKRVDCFTSDPEQRKSYRSWLRQCAERARAVFKRWREGDFSELPPPGFFAPGGALYANLLPLSMVMLF